MKATNLKLLFLVLIGLVAPLCAKAFDESIFTTNTLFIESEDADYTHGQFLTGVHIGMDGPYPGGSYTNLGDVNDQNIDWFAQSTTAPNGTVYRINTLLSAGKERGSGGNNRGTFTVTDWWTLGWNSEGDWENHTRVFPSTPQQYFVFGHLASGGRSIGVEVDVVTSGLGQDDSLQVKQPLGYILPGRATAGWDSLELFPMLDTNGAITTVSLTGTNTIRTFCMTNHDEDMDYIAFVPATTPLFGAQASTRDEITATLQDTPTIQVNTSTLAFTLNGTAITGTAIKTNGLTTVTIPVSPLMTQGATNTLAVTYKDNAANSHSASGSFVVNTFITHPTMFIEAEDADYAHGQFVTTTNIGMDGPYPGGSYTNLGDANDTDFDWHILSGSAPNGQVYRASTLLSAGKEGGSAGNDRGYFTVTDWWTLGWNSGGDWENYTRNFPASNQWYEAYAHLASGGSAIEMRLDQVTSGAGQAGSNQVLKTLGYFSPGRATAGWDSLEVFPLLNAPFPNGKKTVIQLNGKTTMRLTHIGSQDCDYYAFVPVTLPVATITVNTAPQSVTVAQGNVAAFTVAATTSGQYGITYQWKLNGTAIAGANNPSYTTAPLALTDSGGQYTVDINSPGAPTVTTPAAVVTVIKDTTPPAIVSAGSMVTFSNSTEIGVIFDKPLAATAATAANFTLDNGATVSAARWVTNSSGFTTFAADGTPIPDRQQGIILTVSSLTPGTVYHLTVKNVSDYLGNTITSATVPVIVSGFNWVSMGVTATNTAWPNGVENDAFAGDTNSFNLVNGGNAFWGTEDDITMVYQPITGDFDKTSQVEWNDPSSNWARAGISAREDVNPTNAIADFGGIPPRYQMVISDPMTKFDGTTANDAYETNRRLNDGDATTSSNAGGNPKYPGSFVRLKRVGSMISMFWSTNGSSWWMPLGTTDFGDPTVSTNGPLNALMYVGPTLGVENGNITGQGGTTDQQGPFAARFRGYGDMGIKPRGQAAYAVGLNFGANEAGGQLSTNDVVGVDKIAQAHWNNLFGNTPTNTTAIVADKNGAAVATTINVASTGSGNTWASTGPRGEEDGSLLPGNDAIMMTGYLDTGAPSTTTNIITGLPSDLTSGGYDVVVYSQGGVGGRGGALAITDLNGNALRPWAAVQGPTSPTGFIQAVPVAGTNVVGNYLVFTNLNASSIVVLATTDFGYGFGGTARMPVNGIQLVAPAGLLAGTTAPTISISKTGNTVTITFSGTLESSTTVNGTYAPVQGAASPYTVTLPATAPTTFFRAH